MKYKMPNKPPNMAKPDPVARATASSVGRFQRTDSRSYVPSSENASNVPKNNPDDTGAANATNAVTAANAEIPSARRCEGDDGELRGGSGMMLIGNPRPSVLRLADEAFTGSASAAVLDHAAAELTG